MASKAAGVVTADYLDVVGALLCSSNLSFTLLSASLVEEDLVASTWSRRSASSSRGADFLWSDLYQREMIAPGATGPRPPASRLG